jgi:hypothetical protein
MSRKMNYAGLSVFSMSNGRKPDNPAFIEVENVNVLMIDTGPS